MKTQPLMTKSPAELKVEEILARYFPAVETFEARGRDHLDFPEVFVADLKSAVELAFAAGRDFEAKRSKKGGR